MVSMKIRNVGRQGDNQHYWLNDAAIISFFSSLEGWRVGKGGSLRSQLSRKFEGARKWAIFGQD